MDLTTALRMLLIRSKIERGLPFSAKFPEPSGVDAWNAFQDLRKQATDVLEMSLDEINAEILQSVPKEGVALDFLRHY